MQGLELILLLLGVSAALQLLAHRWSVPHPVLLVVVGALIAITPGLPRVTVDPELMFLIFVPPLLYWTSITTSLRDFRRELGPIVRLGVLLVLVSIVAVAATARTLSPEFSWAAAFTLAAIVAPPDPVAATAVMRTLEAPATLVGILEGEGLVNDATALVAYRVAVGAAVTGSFSAPRAGLGILLAGAAGVAIGLAIGWTIGKLRILIRGFPIVENTLSLLTPFIAYLPADRLGASGVLAVVATGFYLGRQGPRLLEAATRVQSEAMWTMATFVLESLVFVLVGLELPYAFHALHGHSLASILWYGVAVSGVLIFVRLAWVFPTTYLTPSFGRTTRQAARPPWQWVAFVGWAGMRGGDSLVIAIALPLMTARGTPFPARDLIVAVTFVVIFVTLVLQGLTFAPLVRLLGLSDGGRSAAEEVHARRVAAEAGLRRLDETMQRVGAAANPAVAALREQQRRRVKLWSGRAGAQPEHTARAEHEADVYREARAAMIEAEREALIGLRDSDEISDSALRRVQRDLDLETMMLEAGEDDAPESPYEPA